MKKTYIIFAAVAFALCSCGGNNNDQNKPNNATQQTEQESVANQENMETLLFKPQATEKDVFPKDCDTVCFQLGDLNNDGIEDLVVAATPRDPKNMMVRDDGYEYKFNKPILAVYFGKGDGEYKLFKEYPNTLPGAEDEFTFVTVGSEITEDGILEFDVEYFNSAGSSQSDSQSYLFKFQDDDFFLIGFDSQSYSRYSGEAENVHRDYLAHKQLTTTFNMLDDKVEADVVFDVDDGITPYDVEKWMAEYI